MNDITITLTREERKEEMKAYMAEYYQKHKDEVLAKNAEYKAKNKEKIAAKRAEYYQKNKDEFAAKHVEYYQKNREKILKQSAEYYQKNKEKKVAYKAEYRAKNKEKIAAKQAEHRSTPFGRARNLVDAYRLSDKKYNRGECTIDARWIVDNVFSGQVCHYCGETDWKLLGVDRKDSSLPHTKENCVPCCKHCNEKKGITPYEEFMRMMGKPV